MSVDVTREQTGNPLVILSEAKDLHCDMKNLEAIKRRYLQDDLPIRLSGIASNLARIASSSINPANCKAVESMLQESEFFIEWTAPEAPLNVQVVLVELQIQLALSYRKWPQVNANPQEREKLSRRARTWSQDVLMLRE
jgi:hypothetical protein